MNGYAVVSESGLGDSGAQLGPNSVRLEQVSAGNHGHSVKFKAQDDNKKQLKTARNREMNYNEPKTGAEVQNSRRPNQDCIHVRARRDQATDSHSLAERARREKISERMKILQDLVPGCSKVTGKAMVLDEIINYVQSLQGQVEFLSMKLEAVNSRVSPGIEVFPPGDVSPNPLCFTWNSH